jgi:hypothetical protein
MKRLRGNQKELVRKSCERYTNAAAQRSHFDNLLQSIHLKVTEDDSLVGWGVRRGRCQVSAVLVVQSQLSYILPACATGHSCGNNSS